MVVMYESDIVFWPDVGPGAIESKLATLVYSLGIVALLVNGDTMLGV